MDLATIIGLVGGVASILYGISLRAMTRSEVFVFLDAASLLIVLGGTFSALLVGTPLIEVLRAWRVALRAFFHRTESPVELIERLARFAEHARRDGVLAIEPLVTEDDDPFLSEGVDLVVDGNDAELIEQIMSTELKRIEDRHSAGRRIFEMCARYAPAWGMVGTLLGLVLMLGHLDEPENIGPGMSLALITTLYGLVFAHLFFGPIADKLVRRSEEELAIKEIIMRGICSIQSGDNPRVLRSRLFALLPPRLRPERW